MAEKIVQMRRLPAIATLYSHTFGLAVAFISGVAAIVYESSGGDMESIITVFAKAGILAVGTFLGGYFVVLSLVLVWIPGAWQTFFLLYLLGYLLGNTFATSYNWFIYWYLNRFSRRVRISFAYDRNKKFNIIKSPLFDEEQAFNRLDDDDRALRLYKHKRYNRAADGQLERGAPPYPYTIAFIANPSLRDDTKNDFKKDPICQNAELFYRSVDKALQSLETNEVIGYPEIWSRIRVVTIFDDTLEPREANNLADGLRDGLTQDGELIRNILTPVPGMIKPFEDILDNVQAENSGTKIRPSDIDVIYVLSASDSFTRASAIFSDFPTSDEETIRIQQATAASHSDQPSQDFPGHEFYATIPGRIAVNVLTARPKTFVHEFAHAMSSYKGEAIADEYADLIQVADIADDISKNGRTRNEILSLISKHSEHVTYINRQRKNNPAVQNPGDLRSFIASPKKFKTYGGVDYFTDLTHPSAEDNWLSYFPERFNPDVPCTMDASTGQHRFDTLLSAFIYERLAVKINRPETNQGGPDAS